MNKICTSIEQSKKLIELGIDVNTADMCYYYDHNWSNDYIEIPKVWNDEYEQFIPESEEDDIPAWSLSALLKLIPKHISRKDKIHYDGQTFIPSFKWEISPTAIYYTDGNDIMDNVSFGYGENNMELIDAMFKMVCWLKEHGEI